MNAAIRRTAFFLGLAFLVLFANLNYIQATRSDDLGNDPRNRRQIIREFGTRRGDILAADNTVLAHSIDSGDERYRYIREYPQKALFGHLTGYYSFFYGASGLEDHYDDVLQGREPARASRFVDELLGREPAGNTIRLTVDPVLQGLARRAFHGQEGGAAVIDTDTGAILALYGDPGFDPNPLSGTPSEQERIQAAWQKIQSNPEQPLLSKAFAQRYPPGSSFKIVVAAAGLVSGMSSSTALPDPSALDLPDSDRVLPNWQGGSCAGGGSITMSTALAVSCNTYFAQTAMRIGPKRLDNIARRFGFGSGFDAGITVAPSCVVGIPGGGCQDADGLARPFTAYSGIGQYQVGVTPLQMALVAATVENGGVRAEPYLVERIVDPTGETIAKHRAKLNRVLPKSAAKQLDQMMVGVVRYGTGSVVGFRDASSGTIGGKTGTAESGSGAPHVWFVAYGPGIAVAVVVEHGGDLRNEATGGKVAGPIAKVLLEKAMARRSRFENTPVPVPSDLPEVSTSFPSTTPTPSEEP